MTIEAYISICRQRLVQIEAILQQMQKYNISPNAPVWDVLNEKYLWWTSRIEACAQTDPGHRYQLGEDYFWN